MSLCLIGHPGSDVMENNSRAVVLFCCWTLRVGWVGMCSWQNQFASHGAAHLSMAFSFTVPLVCEGDREGQWFGVERYGLRPFHYTLFIHLVPCTVICVNPLAIFVVPPTMGKVNGVPGPMAVGVWLNLWAKVSKSIV